MDKTNQRKNTGLIICIILLLVIIVMGIFLYKLYTENKVLSTENEKLNAEKEDTSTQTISSNKSLTYEEYLSILDKSQVFPEFGGEYDDKDTKDAYDKCLKDETNVKKVYATRLGAQHAGLYFLVISNDGNVKLIDFYQSDGNQCIDFQPLANYQVKDIVKLEKDGYNLKLTIELLNGNKTDVEFKAL